jgi:2,4'-dihydroxyacetophenone dioxygenase
MLPHTVSDHHELLTVNTNDLPVYKDALVPGVDVQPLFLDPNNGVWGLRVMFHPGVFLPKHYHTGTVHLWTLSGKWNYVEYPDQPQTAGSYLFEPGGSIHTFSVPADNTEITETLMLVQGANVNFDEEGNYHSIMDASSIMLLIDSLIQEHGLDPAKYIKATQPDYSA